MNTNTVSIEQQANVTAVSGNVQLIRDGFFLPAQVGMALLPGDRVVSDINAKAVIQFTGVNDALVIEKGAAATFNLEVVEMDEAPQWIATELYGQGVYFDSQAAVNTAQAGEEAPNLFGLFGSGSGTSSAGESTGYPVLESVLALGATAAVFSDNDDNPPATSTTNESNAGETTNPPPAGTPQPPAEPQPEPNPLDGIIGPISGALDGLLGATGIASPLGTLGNQSQTDILFSSLSSTESTR
ncbi:hypothetical protein [Limnobacter parvus]|uniref:FecR protein domain-containing protein n=1 Tax=Limnobacter parvus TaxID=2939690 RepID=A0ABT1XDE4_9BURK|nr:hypothetical protein [Limnobacter parvus]MCR2745296.1 hypothetical protein [Limnobacter parvus]